MMKIETERLYIRHFVNEDASICFEGWGTDEHLGDFIMGYPMNMDQMNSFVNAMVKNTNAWVIVEKESGACIGYKLYLICFLPQKVQNGVGNEVMG